MKCSYCNRTVRKKYFIQALDEEDADVFCSRECALAANKLVPVTRVPCACCGVAVGTSTIADELSGDLYCSITCALTANNIKCIE